MVDISTHQGTVVAVCRNAEAGLPKPVVEEVHLIADWGVEGDYHAGKLVRHRFLAKKDPTKPNLRQVCLVDASAFEDLKEQGLDIGPGMMGENITITGIALMQLAPGTEIAIGSALVKLTEVRNPCVQLNGIDPRLLKAVVKSDEHGKKIFKAGIMAQVLVGGVIRAGERVQVLDEVASI